MTGARASIGRRFFALLPLVLVLGLLYAAGCGDEESTYTFTPAPPPPVGNWFLAVWGSGADDVFVVGQPGLIYHWDGTTWSREQSGTDATLTDVWGDGTGTVYATGHRGTILRRNAASGAWSSMTSGTGEDLFALGTYQGTVMAAGRKGALRRLVGQSWVGAPELIFTRDGATILDTLTLSKDVKSLTAVAHYGIGGSEGSILMADPVADWQLRRITGGQEWVTCAASSEEIGGNYLATDEGRLYQLGRDEEDQDRLVWGERYSLAIGAIVYGMHRDDGDTLWAVTNDGRVNRLDPPHVQAISFTEVYDDGLVLFDIWGTGSDNLYAVGIDGRVLRYHDQDGVLDWRLQDLPDLPEDKSLATEVFDKFGRPVHR